jgi:type III restriction enzyme
MEVTKKYEYLANSEQLKSPEIQAKIVEEIKTLLPPTQIPIPTLGKEPDLAKIVEIATNTLVEKTIDIPNIVLIPKEQVNFGYSDFNLENLDTINYQPVAQEILIKYLRTPDKSYILGNETQQKQIRLENYLVNILIQKGEIDYDSNADLLYKLTAQVVNHLKSYLPNDDAVENVLLYHQKILSDFIFKQMLQHYWGKHSRWLKFNGN